MFLNYQLRPSTSPSPAPHPSTKCTYTSSWSVSQSSNPATWSWSPFPPAHFNSKTNSGDQCNSTIKVGKSKTPREVLVTSNSGSIICFARGVKGQGHCSLDEGISLLEDRHMAHLRCPSLFAGLSAWWDDLHRPIYDVYKAIDSVDLVEWGSKAWSRSLLRFCLDEC